MTFEHKERPRKFCVLRHWEHDLQFCCKPKTLSVAVA